MDSNGRLFSSHHPMELIRMLEMRRQGMSYVAIAHHYGKDHSTIIYHCKKHHVVPLCPRVKLEIKIPVIIEKYIPPEPKYVLIIEEKICRGKNYAEYCKERGIKIPPQDI